MANLLTRYEAVFSKSDQQVSRTELVHHSIPTTEGTRPNRQPLYRLLPHKEQEAACQVQDLLARGMIEPANRAWSSPVSPGTQKRPVLAVLRGLQEAERRDAASGYWQVPLYADAQEKSAFTTCSGLWKWKVLLFGLTSAPATFQRLMEQVLHGLHWKTLVLYLDDVIVISPDFTSHLQRLEDVFERL